MRPANCGLHRYPEHWNASLKTTTQLFTTRNLKSECDGLFTNRLLWLSASARSSLPYGGSGCRNLALRAFMNKPSACAFTPFKKRSRENTLGTCVFRPNLLR